jgi:hypothetical protein
MHYQDNRISGFSLLRNSPSGVYVSRLGAKQIGQRGLNAPHLLLCQGASKDRAGRPASLIELEQALAGCGLYPGSYWDRLGNHSYAEPVRQIAKRADIDFLSAVRVKGFWSPGYSSPAI